MSPLWRDRIHVRLDAGRLALVRQQRGLLPKPGAQLDLPLANPAGDWRVPVAALADMLRNKTEWHGADLSVTIANAFVRFQLLPWSTAIENDAELQAYARQSFVQVYDKLCSDWSYQISATGVGAPWLAAALDQAMLQAVEVAAQQGQCRLIQLRPSLMPVFNAARAQFKADDFWYVQPEAGHLMMSLVTQSSWRCVANPRCDEDWLGALPEHLDRLWQIHGTGKLPRTVYVAGLEARQSLPSQLGPWTLRKLNRGQDPISTLGSHAAPARQAGG